MTRDISFGGTGISDQFKFRFYSDLHVLVSSGLDLKSAFDLLREESDSKSVQGRTLEEVATSVKKGLPLSVSLENQKGFTQYEFSTINIGEETGNLPKVLSDLSTYYDRKLKLRRELISAFSYPVMIMVVAFAAVAFMLAFVVPVFQDLFSRMNQELPWLTQQIVSLSDFAGSYWWICLLLIVFVLAAYVLTRRNESVRGTWQAVIWKMPLFGSFVTKSVLARFANSMGFLLSCNVTLLKALELSANMVDFAPLKGSIQRVSQGLIEGQSLEELLNQEQIFNKRFVAMMRVGEEINQLPEVFQHLGIQYQDDMERSTKNLSSFIEPVMIVFVGLMVGVILVAMYLPLFEMKGGF